MSDQIVSILLLGTDISGTRSTTYASARDRASTASRASERRRRPRRAGGRSRAPLRWRIRGRGLAALGRARRRGGPGRAHPLLPGQGGPGRGSRSSGGPNRSVTRCAGASSTSSRPMKAPAVADLVEAVVRPFVAVLDADPVAGLAWMKLFTALALSRGPDLAPRGRPLAQHRGPVRPGSAAGAARRGRRRALPTGGDRDVLDAERPRRCGPGGLRASDLERRASTRASSTSSSSSPAPASRRRP